MRREMAVSRRRPGRSTRRSRAVPRRERPKRGGKADALSNPRVVDLVQEMRQRGENDSGRVTELALHAVRRVEQGCRSRLSLLQRVQRRRWRRSARESATARCRRESSRVPATSR